METLYVLILYAMFGLLFKERCNKNGRFDQILKFFSAKGQIRVFLLRKLQKKNSVIFLKIRHLDCMFCNAQFYVETVSVLRQSYEKSFQIFVSQ